LHRSGGNKDQFVPNENEDRRCCAAMTFSFHLYVAALASKALRANAKSAPAANRPTRLTPSAIRGWAIRALVIKKCVARSAQDACRVGRR
jgi:hypothetical protein